MMPRRLLSSLAGSCVVVTIFGCNAIVGNEDVDYTESTPTKTSSDGSTSSGPTDPTASSDGSTSDDGGIRDAEATGDDETIDDAAVE